MLCCPFPFLCWSRPGRHSHTQADPRLQPAPRVWRCPSHQVQLGSLIGGVTVDMSRGSACRWGCGLDTFQLASLGPVPTQLSQSHDFMVGLTVRGTVWGALLFSVGLASGHGEGPDLLPLLGWAATWFLPGHPAPPSAFLRELGCGPFWILVQPPGASSSSGRWSTGDKGCTMQAVGEEGEGQGSGRGWSRWGRS